MTDILKPCPFCGSADIDPEGVASFKDQYRKMMDTCYTWNENANQQTIEHRPACNNCGATTNGEWNDRNPTVETTTACAFINGKRYVSGDELTRIVDENKQRSFEFIEEEMNSFARHAFGLRWIKRTQFAIVLKEIIKHCKEQL